MRTFLIVAACAAGLAGCSQTERGAAFGGATGAVAGAIVTGSPEGAILGGAMGAAGGALIGAASEPGQCYYRDSRGRRYIDECRY